MSRRSTSPSPGSRPTGGAGQTFHISTTGAVVIGDVDTGGGDFVGRDMLTGSDRREREVHGPQPHVAEDVHEPVTRALRPGAEVDSLRRQLEVARENLRLIEERKGEYVLEVDVPLQLIKEERRLRERIAELEHRLSVSPSRCRALSLGCEALALLA